MGTALTMPQAGPTPREIIERIRRDKFLIGADVPDRIRAGLDELRGMLDNALKLLSDDLYQKKSHFVLELVQNADDNHYGNGVSPRLSIRVARNCLVVANNEIGFPDLHVVGRGEPAAVHEAVAPRRKNTQRKS